MKFSQKNFKWKDNILGVSGKNVDRLKIFSDLLYKLAAFKHQAQIYKRVRVEFYFILL